MSARTVIRRPAFGSHGRKIIAAFCAWEILALVPGSPVPTISTTVRSYPAFGWLLLGLLGHHWFIEMEQMVGGLLEAADEAISNVLGE